MRRHYRIRDHVPPTEAETSRYRDFARLVYLHERMTRPLYKRPLYKDPKAFLVILVIVLLAILVAEVVEKEKVPMPPPVNSGQRP